jgi:hypothetical protein
MSQLGQLQKWRPSPTVAGPTWLAAGLSSALAQRHRSMPSLVAAARGRIVIRRYASPRWWVAPSAPIRLRAGLPGGACYIGRRFAPTRRLPMTVCERSFGFLQNEPVALLVSPQEQTTVLPCVLKAQTIPSAPHAAPAATLTRWSLIWRKATANGSRERAPMTGPAMRFEGWSHRIGEMR